MKKKEEEFLVAIQIKCGEDENICPYKKAYQKTLTLSDEYKEMRAEDQDIPIEKYGDKEVQWVVSIKSLTDLFNLAKSFDGRLELMLNWWYKNPEVKFFLSQP